MIILKIIVHICFIVGVAFIVNSLGFHGFYAGYFVGIVGVLFDNIIYD